MVVVNAGQLVSTFDPRQACVRSGGRVRGGARNWKEALDVSVFQLRVGLLCALFF